MTAKPSLEMLAAIVHDNPRRSTEGLWDYLERLCVLAGAMEPGSGRLPKDYAFVGADEERQRARMELEEARLPYREV